MGIVNPYSPDVVDTDQGMTGMTDPSDPNSGMTVEGPTNETTQTEGTGGDGTTPVTGSGSDGEMPVIGGNGDGEMPVIGGGSGSGDNEDEMIVGGPTFIRCQDGKYHSCNAGTQFCYDNTPQFCIVSS